MTRRTSLNLDFELVERARAVLGTNGTTDTIHRALEETVRRDLLEGLVEERFELTDEERRAAWRD